MTRTNPTSNQAARRPISADPSLSPKIKSWHLDRLAVVYVRQSTPQQVAENRESTDRQYALVNRAIELGWSPERILVIGEDQGKSGATTDNRLGFQHLLAEVSLDHVGLILGLEMSRLACSCKDWHQLLELCALFRTILADQDGLYDPTDHNDRLLLGLTGIMSEAELHLLRGRMRQGLLNKVRRGEIFLDPPVGYVRSPNGQLLLAVPLEEGEQPVGEIGGPGRVGGHEEFDDPQLGIGHGRSPLEPNGSRSPVLGVVYVPIHRIHPFYSPPDRSAARIFGTAADGLTRPCDP